WASNKFVLNDGTTFEYPGVVLNTFLPGLRRFAGSYRIGHMAGEDDSLLAGLRCCREVSVARNHRLDLDKVHAFSFEAIPGMHSICRARNLHGCGKVGFGSIEHRAGRNHPRPQHFSLRDGVSPLQNSW